MKPPVQKSILAVVATISIFVPACEGDECPAGTRRCTDNVAETCVYTRDTELGGHLEWRREPCGPKTCQVPPDGSRGFAFCALDEAPDPACPDALREQEQASRCIDNTVVSWAFGFRVKEEPCPTRTSCADVSNPAFDSTCTDVAFCSPLPSRDPLCQAGVVTTCQDASTIVYCRCGFRQDAHPCSSPGPSCTSIPVAEGVPEQGACR